MISWRLGRRMAHSSERIVGSGSPRQCLRTENRTAFTLATRVLLAALAVVLVSGCGRYKEDLEQAKQRIDTLTADNKKCSETMAGLERDRQRLAAERQTADKEIESLLKELADLKKANAALSEERNQLTKKNNELSSELLSLKREKFELSKQVEELKSGPTQAIRPEQTPKAGRPEGEALRAAGPTIPKAPENLIPCKAVLEYMKASEKVVRGYRGAERTSMLEKVKKEFSPRMKGAPEKAIKNSQKWVDELSSSWDKPGGDMVFNLLTKRNAVLDACKIKPSDAGF